MDVMSLFPPGSALDADGMLTVGGCRADDLAREFGTPALIVAEPALRERAREYARELAARRPRSRVVFASKAFPCTRFVNSLQKIRCLGFTGLKV